MAVIETFNNIYSLLNALDNRSNNKVWGDGPQSSDYGSQHFTGTKSYEEAKALFLNGYSEPLPEFKEAIKGTPTSTRRQTYAATAGHAPHIPNAIQGLPNSMIATRTIKNKARTIEIYYSPSTSGSTDKEDLTKAGKNLLAAINKMERSGIRIKLQLIIIASRVDAKNIGVAAAAVTLKNYTEHINLLKLCFPLVHPSLLRRIGFKWLEKAPGRISKQFTSGHGSPLADRKTLQQLFKTQAKIINFGMAYNHTPEEITEYLLK